LRLPPTARRASNAVATTVGSPSRAAGTHVVEPGFAIAVAGSGTGTPGTSRQAARRLAIPRVTAMISATSAAHRSTRNWAAPSRSGPVNAIGCTSDAGTNQPKNFADSYLITDR